MHGPNVPGMTMDIGTDDVARTLGVQLGRASGPWRRAKWWLLLGVVSLALVAGVGFLVRRAKADVGQRYVTARSRWARRPLLLSAPDPITKRDKDRSFCAPAPVPAVDPRISARFKLTDKQRIVQAYGLAHQPPSFSAAANSELGSSANRARGGLRAGANPRRFRNRCAACSRRSRRDRCSRAR